MSMENIERMLRQRIGLHTESVGRSAISSAVGRRMATRQIGTVHEYCQCLSATTDELDELIETVVIPETWFFRDGRPFQVLRKVAAQLDAVRPTQRLRVLSVPCATGEEPYSIAMTLLEAGIPAARIQVDAIDISRRVLEFARAGSYGSHSFRGDQDASMLERYFSRHGTRFQISAQVQSLVHFDRGNLLDPDFPASAGAYDVIFCRNLMIYFDEQAKQTAYHTLQRILADHGLLFVGHAEGGTVPPALFHNAGRALAFAFRKGPAKPQCSGPSHARTNTPPPPANARSNPLRRPARSSTTPSRPPPAPPAPTQEQPDGDPLELARQLADLGRLAEAREICEAHLNGPYRQAETYYLLGIIRIAEDDSQGAEDALRRALYLHPKHYEALVQMTLLLEQRGDRIGAARMRQRAERAAPEHSSDDAR